MAIHKEQQKGSLLDIHDGKHARAPTLAARTRANIEVARFECKDTLEAFLDCSKFYGRAGHKLAGGRAAASGLQSRVAVMICDMYKGAGHLIAHGAVVMPRTRNHGLVAGCAFAKDVLKASIATVKKECPEGRPRDYADDITLGVKGDTTTGCAARMHDQLEKLRNCALPKDHMALIDGKQPALGLRKEVRGRHGHSMGRPPRSQRSLGCTTMVTKTKAQNWTRNWRGSK